MKAKIIIAALCAIVASASAQTTTGIITGVVTSIDNPGGLMPSGINLGDAVSATFTYGTVASSSSMDAQSNRYSFSSGDFSFVVTIGSSTWTYTSGSGSVQLQDNHPVHNRDQYYVETGNINGTPGSFPGAIQSSYLAVGIYDWTSPFDLISGLTLPRATSDVNLSAATQTQGVVSTFGSGGPTNQWTLNYSVATLSLTTSAIPEPSTIAFISGLAALVGAIISRTRKRFDARR